MFNRRVQVLIIGGTGLISTGIVQGLRERGAAITVFNRGRTDDRLGPDVRRLVGARQDFPAFAGTMAAAGLWDVVIEMICFVSGTPRTVGRSSRRWRGHTRLSAVL